MLAYLYDNRLHQQLNGQGRNYWDIYYEEIGRQLGIHAAAVTPADVERLDTMPEIRALIIGRQTGRLLNGASAAALQRWVENGGVLIACGVEGLDTLFGIQHAGTLREQDDDYSIAAHFDLRPHSLTHEVHPMMFIEQKLLIVSDVAMIRTSVSAEDDTGSAVELGHLYDTAGNDLQQPAITWRAVGKGYAGYFAFDVAQTVWLLHQGRPIALDVEQTRGYPRAYDLGILAGHSRKVAYADEIVTVLQNMIAQGPAAFVYAIPPKQGQVADALLYWGGDEYTGPTELSLTASDWMKQQQLPYHINLQAENHPMTQEEYEHIISNGHEISEYYHMLAEDGWAAYEQLYQRQSDEFYERFGTRPITTVNCVLRWNGWADAARWMANAGSKADNSISGHPMTLGHPLANMSFFGMGTGTPFPFYFYDDAAHGNAKLDMLEQPIVCYEVGHRGSLLDHETVAVDEVHLPVEMALKYHWVMNMFYHPVYIARYPQCRAAIEEILHTIERKQGRVVHLGNDALHHWWQRRAQAQVKLVEASAVKMQWHCQCDYEDGMVIKVLLKRPARMVKADNRYPVEYEIRHEFAGAWLYVVVEAGQHTIDVVFND